ncbi:hypothetical protein [Mangrovitalea sediminis]|nr:hypothetical protein [Mangrovitalea sediminis]
MLVLAMGNFIAEKELFEQSVKDAEVLAQQDRLGTFLHCAYL